jgi:CHAT domain
MEQSNRVYPMQLVLNYDEGMLLSSLYWEGYEGHVEAKLPPNLVSEYRRALVFATGGLLSSTKALQDVLDVMLTIAVPEGARQRLDDLNRHTLQGHLIALEIVIDHPILEAFPWELLCQPGKLMPSETDITSWRSIEQAARLTQGRSDSILLVGSAPIDSESPHTHRELELIIEGIDARLGVMPHPYPAISFRSFRTLLPGLQPAVLHLVVHGDVRSFRFQDDPDPGWTLFQNSQHHDIHYQEFIAHVSRSRATSVVVLNACDSATARDGKPPIARQLATSGELTVIGMAAKLPARVGIAFAQAFHQRLTRGASIIEAHSAGVQISVSFQRRTPTSGVFQCSIHRNPM